MKQKNYSQSTEKTHKKWRKGLLSTILLCLLATAAVAQNAVTGKVTDASDGSGLPGVSIQVKGTNTGAQTDANGSFKISVPANATLIFSFVFLRLRLALSFSLPVASALKTGLLSWCWRLPFIEPIFTL